MASAAIQGTRDSVLDRIDARTRLLAALAFVVAVVALNSPWLIGAVFVAAMALAWMGGLPFAALAHRLLHVEGFMIALLAVLPFTVPGEPLFALGPFTATEEGLVRAAMIALKANAAVAVIFALISSLELVRLGRAMAGLGAPQAFVSLFLLTARYIGVFQAESGRLRDAMRARAFAARSNWHTWRTLGNLAGMLLVRSIERAERVHEAMRCRAYAGRFSAAPAEPFGGADAAFAVVVGLAVMGLFLADRFA